MFKLFSLFSVLALLLVAALDQPSAAAQNDERTGRIVARLLDDGRVEFGWQPAGGARVLPRQRYFPADITHNRWLRSSPVEVAGAEIGRINARQAEDGRIEFAFTPTDGERIQPQARYFPADVQVGRWLRSTEIAIGPVAPGYIAVSAGGRHTCAIPASDSAIECWGANGYPYYDDNIQEHIQETGLTDAPEGSYTAVSAGGYHTCAIREDKTIACWGESPYFEDVGVTNAPDGHFTAISAGAGHNCAIRDTREIACWGRNKEYTGRNAETQEPEWADTGQATPPEGAFTAVSAGAHHTCGLRDTGEIACWGWNKMPTGWNAETQESEYANTGQATPPEGAFTAVSAGAYHTCGLRDTGEIACWGANDGLTATGYLYATGRTDAPDGRFTAVSASRTHTCAISGTGAITCWGSGPLGSPSDAPPGTFRAVSAGGAGSFHTCAIRESGEIACWGWNNYGQATPPTD